jgi:hypothetical protein
MREIPLSKNYFALVDDKDFEQVSQHKWSASESPYTVYAVRNIYTTEGKRRLEYLHRFLCPDAEWVDHDDHNGLNCQRYNLRPCSPSNNGCNREKIRKPTSSKYKGVYLQKADRKHKTCWVAQITIEGRRTRLGEFGSEDEAAAAYNKVATKHFGEFALINEISSF